MKKLFETKSDRPEFAGSINVRRDTIRRVDHEDGSISLRFSGNYTKLARVLFDGWANWQLSMSCGDHGEGLAFKRSCTQRETLGRAIQARLFPGYHEDPSVHEKAAEEALSFYEDCYGESIEGLFF